MSITKRGKQLTGGFHAGIIALLLLGILLAGCGYKTAPVYVPPHDHNQTVDAR
jgi:predicted small lipoprotein YifL